MSAGPQPTGEYRGRPQLAASFVSNRNYCQVRLLGFAAIGGRENPMKRFFLIGAAACALSILPALPTVAAPFGAPLTGISQPDSETILVKGGHGGGRGHMGRGNRGRHLGWTRGRHRGWR